ncbi:uncharacterized protein LOC110812422 [Carica papaya]|uniref:uncharacterized protein LOC110812422 n=1 Tax=Carica papaya TaxID=3649 RepID=UPI000B8CB2FF|nr:uncharacterized protein LOC110812422 [Carica papaya]
MKKLTRKWRNSHDDKFSLPTRDDDDSRPIDSQEQEEFVRSLERTQAQQSRQWRTVFAALVFCYAAFLVYSIFQQFSSPWELVRISHFEHGMIESHDLSCLMLVSLADWVAVLACSLAITGLLNNSNDHARWIWYSCSVGLALTVFWLYYMLSMPKFHWDVIWLPFGPVSGAGMCLYVNHLLVESSEEVRKLRGYMYSYKAS